MRAMATNTFQQATELLLHLDIENLVTYRLSTTEGHLTYYDFKVVINYYYFRDMSVQPTVAGIYWESFNSTMVCPKINLMTQWGSISSHVILNPNMESNAVK